MTTKLSQVSMKFDDDPRVLFNQLATIQSKYNNATQKIDPYDLICEKSERRTSNQQITQVNSSNDVRQKQAKCQMTYVFYIYQLHKSDMFFVTKESRMSEN
jgi:hypothetical protein